ncbi:hypothetical protein BWI92_07085 [Flectobacillus sp. BAB-3569]|nr:hypothetical protein BWI92_07085 [Flectobacillus sp. BAB-3569]
MTKLFKLFKKQQLFGLILRLTFCLETKSNKNSRIYKLASLKQYKFIAYASNSTKFKQLRQ